MNTPFSLAGKTALVTGATGHLGRSMAHGLAAAGARVLVNSRDACRAERLVNELHGYGYAAEAAVFDVTDAVGIQSFFNEIKEPLHIVVNNAYSGAGGTVRTSRAEDFLNSHMLTVIAAQQLVQATLPLLGAARAATGDASIINIASMYGLVSPDPRIYASPEGTNPPFYGAAKAALLQWTRYAACELGPEGIRVNAISPGPFPADAVRENQPAFMQALSHKVPLGRTGSGHEIAGPLVFLASPASSFVTGSNLIVDGGWTAW
ncbi:SDR family NAD(P)-dependent oxidoreductase [Perlucidibaca piscinae]|uniref:SDR family NAD(P)-dependent oxidoreductase n=1 Tax=Perlucidibaca piscinae TaxID=392589 RepID=UPI0003B64394|nr:SDR family oxidoreductase [Perlucidibaca piscinae]